MTHDLEDVLPEHPDRAAYNSEHWPQADIDGRPLYAGIPVDQIVSQIVHEFGSDALYGPQDFKLILFNLKMMLTMQTTQISRFTYLALLLAGCGVHKMATARRCQKGNGLCLFPTTFTTRDVCTWTIH